MTRKNAETPKTVEEAALRYVVRSGGAVQTKAVTKQIAKEMQTTENTVAQALTRLKAAKRLTQPRKGLWAASQSRDSDATRDASSVEEKIESMEAAIEFLYPDSDEVWFSIELASRVVVHKPKQIRSRMAKRSVEADFA